MHNARGNTILINEEIFEQQFMKNAKLKSKSNLNQNSNFYNLM